MPSSMQIGDKLASLIDEDSVLEKLIYPEGFSEFDDDVYNAAVEAGIPEDVAEAYVSPTFEEWRQLPPEVQDKYERALDNIQNAILKQYPEFGSELDSMTMEDEAQRKSSNLNAYMPEEFQGKSRVNATAKYKINPALSVTLDSLTQAMGDLESLGVDPETIRSAIAKVRNDMPKGTIKEAR